MTTPIFYSGRKPFQATEGSAGLDLYADTKVKKLINFAEIEWIPTGTKVAIPSGFLGLVLPRSSTFKKGLYIHPGTIDSDYRGEIMLGVRAFDVEVIIEPGQRLAQLLIIPTPPVILCPTTELLPTSRNENGFGSTGA